MGQAATGSNFSVAATEKLPVRALSYKAVFSIRATKKLSNKSCQCAPSLSDKTAAGRKNCHLLCRRHVVVDVGVAVGDNGDVDHAKDPSLC